MDNENKNLQGNENELTPEERVQEDISSKIADAAAEVQEEIAEANGEAIPEEAPAEEAPEFEIILEDGEASAEEDLSWSDEAWEEEQPAEPATVTIKKSSFSISLIAAALIGVLITFLGFRIPTWIENLPEGKTVATVNKEEITDLDVNYYIYAEAANHANGESITQDQLGEYDWDKEVDGAKLSDTIKESALNAAIDEAIMLQKGAENGITLSEEAAASIESQLAGIQATYGEDGFALRARTMGIASIKQYSKMYHKTMTLSEVQADMEANPDNYYPEDRSVLSDYAQDDSASVKHILIKVEDEATDEEKRAQAQSILDRVNAGEDFDTLMAEFNEDTGEPETGYTFGPGEMDIAFEEASFALKIDEVSELVKSSYGYHIIKRIAGENELKAYWRAEYQDSIKIKKGSFEKLSVTDVMNDVAAALEELESQGATQ